MDLKTFVSQKRGLVSWLAKEIGAPVSDVSDWANLNKTPSILRCVAIEKATGGKVTRPELRDDWREIWPELSEGE